MKKILLLLFCVPFVGFSQSNDFSEGISITPNVFLLNKDLLSGLDFSLKSNTDLHYYIFGFSSNFNKDEKIQNFYFKPVEGRSGLRASPLNIGFFTSNQVNYNMWYFSQNFNVSYKNFSFSTNVFYFLKKDSNDYFNSFYFLGRQFKLSFGLKYLFYIKNSPKVLNLPIPF